MRLFGKIYVTVLGGLDQGEDKVSQTRWKVRFHLLRVGAPCGEGRGAKSGGQVDLGDALLELKHRLCSLYVQSTI